HLAPSTMALLVNSAHLTALAELTLIRFVPPDAALVELSAATGVPHLTALDLRDTLLGDDRLGVVLRSPLMARLKHLGLAVNPITDDGARLIAAYPALAKLERLDLARTQIGDLGARALLQSPHLNALKELRLTATRRITPPVREELRIRFG